jgi:hypothetical protein
MLSSFSRAALRRGAVLATTLVVGLGIVAAAGAATTTPSTPTTSTPTTSTPSTPTTSTPTTSTPTTSTPTTSTPTTTTPTTTTPTTSTPTTSPTGSGSAMWTNATAALAAIGITPAQFEATSGGVSLAQLQQQLNDLNSGLPVPNLATPPSTTAPLTALSPPTSTSGPQYCQAFGSNTFTPRIGSGGTYGYAELGFLQECKTSAKISSSCRILAKVGRSTGKPGENTHGGRNCSTDTVVGNFRGRKGTVTAAWGGYNETGVFGTLGGCVVDAKSAFCRYSTTFRVGNHSYFGWVPHT